MVVAARRSIQLDADALIRVGGTTEAEASERTLRIEDALFAGGTR